MKDLANTKSEFELLPLNICYLDLNYVVAICR